MGMVQRIWQARTSYLLVLPILLLYGVFSLLPIGQTFFLSLYNAKIVSLGEFVGLGNYQSLVLHSGFRQAAANTVVFTAICSLASIAVSLPLAALLHLRMTRARPVLQAIYFLPVVTPGAAIGYIWKWLYDTKFGLLNTALLAVGIEGPRWLSDPKLALYSIAAVMVWATTGYFMVIFLAHLDTLDPALYEAAAIDGAGTVHQFLYITLPLLRGAISLVLILGIIFFMQAFVLVWTMTRGGPGGSTHLITTLSYQQAFMTGSPRFGLSAAASTLLFLAILLCTVVAARVTRFLEDA